jgi:hypothetical protein
VPNFFVTIFKSDSKKNIVKDLIDILFIYALTVIGNLYHTFDIYIFCLRLNSRRYLIELPHERAFEKAFLEEKHEQHSQMMQRFIETTCGFETIEY